MISNIRDAPGDHIRNDNAYQLNGIFITISFSFGYGFGRKTRILPGSQRALGGVCPGD